MKNRLFPVLLVALMSAGAPHAVSAQRYIHDEFRQCLAAATTEAERTQCHWQKRDALQRLAK